jgi:hypothetical protein
MVLFFSRLASKIVFSKNKREYLPCGLILVTYYVLTFFDHWQFGVKALAYSVPFFNLVGLYFLLSKQLQTEKIRDPDGILLAILTAGLLSCFQLYHDSHPGGLFWATVISSFSVVYTVYLCSQKSRPILFVTLFVFCLPCVIVKSKTIYHVIKKTRKEFAAGSPLKGMWESPDRVKHLERIVRTIRVFEAQSGPRPTILLGGDALFSALSGKPQSPRGLYVGWGSLKKEQEKEERKKFILLYDPILIRQAPGSFYFPEDPILDFAIKQRNYQLLNKGEHQDYGPYEIYVRF